MNAKDALTILPWCGIQERVDGRVTRVAVPGRPSWSDGSRGAPRMASVSIMRENGILYLDCRVCGCGDAAEAEPCKGMEAGAICYHAVAAAMAAAGEAGALYFVDNPADFAKRKGGKLVKLQAAYASPGRLPGIATAVLVPRHGSKAPATPPGNRPGEAVKSLPAKLDTSTHCPCGIALEASQLESGLCSACDKSTPPLLPLPVKVKPPSKRKAAR
jgi:hypothetical protein